MLISIDFPTLFRGAITTISCQMHARGSREKRSGMALLHPARRCGHHPSKQVRCFSMPPFIYELNEGGRHTYFHRYLLVFTCGSLGVHLKLHIYMRLRQGGSHRMRLALSGDCYTLRTRLSRREDITVTFCKRLLVLYAVSFKMQRLNQSFLSFLLLSVALSLAHPISEDTAPLSPRARFCANSPHTVAGT